MARSSATSANYEAGYLARGFKMATWFVTNDGGEGRLRRATTNCPRDNTCGDVVADNVEGLQMRIYQPPLSGATAWTDLTNTGARLTTSERLRVDLEIVMRSRAEDRNQTHKPVLMALYASGGNLGYCIPGGAAAPGPTCVDFTPDKFRRLVMRASVDIRNAGRMRFLRRGGP